MSDNEYKFCTHLATCVTWVIIVAVLFGNGGWSFTLN